MVQGILKNYLNSPIDYLFILREFVDKLAELIFKLAELNKLNVNFVLIKYQSVNPDKFKLMK